jgi:gamma-glutamyltranspeptidase / glutathione hydrolase
VFTTRPELVGTYGIVASTHWLASSAGMAVLESGGNAFDAAVAAGLTLQVVEPHLNGPGGEVPIIFHSAERGETRVLGGQGPAPAAANIAHFEELGLELVPGTGLLAACVPGAFDAWMVLLGEFGTLRLAEVMRYAIDYADHGYPLVPGISATIGGVEKMFRDEWTSSAQLYLRCTGVPTPGTLFSNPDLASTFRRILERAESRSADRDEQIEAARDAFYRGFVAETIEQYVTSTLVMDTSGRRHKGLLSSDDLAAYRAELEAPATLDYQGYTVCKTGAWGQGPVFLKQLALLEGFDLADMGHNTAEYIHTVVESAKLAFADREAYYGDPRFVDVPLDGLLDPSYAQERRALIEENASYELRPGSVGGREPRLPPFADAGEASKNASAGAGEPTIPRDDQGSGDTCHVDVVDRHGNMVSATPSGGWLQSSPVIPALGFPLGTRAQMFWLTEGLPNSLEGGKRPRTTLTPSLALREGEPYLAFGTPGGDQQDQWSLNFFLAHVHFDLNLQEAIDAPNFHTEHFPSSFYPRPAAPGKVVVEDRLNPDIIAGLQARGHELDIVDGWSLGRLSAVSRNTKDGSLRGAANPRGMQGYAVGR